MTNTKKDTAPAAPADAHVNCRRKPCPYCKAIVAADDGPETDDTYLGSEDPA